MRECLLLPTRILYFFVQLETIRAKTCLAIGLLLFFMTDEAEDLATGVALAHPRNLLATRDTVISMPGSLREPFVRSLSLLEDVVQDSLFCFVARIHCCTPFLFIPGK